MDDSQKTREELSKELAELRQRLAQQETEYEGRVSSLRKRTCRLEQRAKDLQCLHDISRLLTQPDLPLDELLQGIVQLLPQAWPYPEIRSARILIGDQEFRAAGHVETPWQQVQEIASGRHMLGRIEVCYQEERPEQEDGPFLHGERALLEAIAGLVAGAIQRDRDRRALLESEATVKGLLDAVTDWAMLIDRKDVVLHVNEAMAERLGRSPDELLGAVARELVPGDVAEAERGFFWDLVHCGETIRFEHERNGVWFENSIFPILDAEGEVARVAILGRDISHFRELERALRESERAYRTLFEQALVGIVRSDADGTLIAVNPAAVGILGYGGTEELIGQPAEEIWFSSEDRSQAIGVAQALGYLPRQEVALRKKDGTRIPCLATAAILRETDGGFGGFVATFTDITEQKRTEEALRQSHGELEQRVERRTVALTETNALLQRELAQRKQADRWLRQANRRLKMLIECRQAVIRTTEEGTLLAEVCRIVVDAGGYRLAWIGYAEQDENQTVRPVAQAGYEEGYLDTLHITWADHDRGRGPTGTAIRTGRPCPARDIQRDPEFAPWRAEAVKRGYASSLALPLNSDGGCLGSLNIYAAEPDAFDLEEVGLLQQLADDLAFGILALRTQSEHRQAKKALQRSLEELSSLQRLGRRVGASVSPDEIVQTVLEEIVSIVVADAALLMLRNGEDLQVKQIHSPDGAHAEMGDPVHRVGECLCGLAVRDRQPIYVRDIQDDPRCTWKECKGASLRSFAALPLHSGDAVIGVLGLASAAERAFDEQASFLETIADQVAVALENARLSREAAELQVLREVDRLRSKLLADVSHELRTPLGLIKIFASTLLREDVVFDRETQVEFLYNIEEEADNLRAIVDNLLGLSRAESGRLRLALQRIDLLSVVGKAVGTAGQRFTHHRLVEDLVAEPLMVEADPAMLDQVLRNLLDNAAKYSPPGSRITVVGRATEGEAFVRVVDEGIGIAEKDLERIFERFYRVDNEFTRRVRGIGLGLALCREIVNAHGGLIWAESVPGEGSAFVFSLPLVVDAES